MLLKCCTQYASRFRKLSSIQQDWKRSVFITLSKNGNAKECSNYHQLCSSHILARSCLKSFKLGINSMWTVNFQMYNLDLEKTQKAAIKLPTSIGSSKKAKEFQKSIYLFFIDYAKTFDCVDHCKLWKILKEMGVPDHLTCFLRNLYAV